MRKTLGSGGFIRNGLMYDYCVKETLECLLDLCDQVWVVDVGSSDGTVEMLKEMKKRNYRLNVVYLDNIHWEKDSYMGKERIAHYQTLASSFLDTDYQILLQFDEVLHPKSFPIIREAIETGKEGFVVDRINFWGSANTYLNVPEHRSPCSTKVIRIGKVGYSSVDDGESYGIDNPTYLPGVEIFHVGFIRRKEIMKSKVIEMQEGVFKIPHDPKLDGIDYFDSERWFKGEELSEFKGEHPHYIKKYLINRP